MEQGQAESHEFFKRACKCLTRSLIVGVCHVLGEIGYHSNIVGSTCHQLEVAPEDPHS